MSNSRITSRRRPTATKRDENTTYSYALRAPTTQETRQLQKETHGSGIRGPTRRKEVIQRHKLPLARHKSQAEHYGGCTVRYMPTWRYRDDIGAILAQLGQVGRYCMSYIVGGYLALFGGAFHGFKQRITSLGQLAQ